MKILVVDSDQAFMEYLINLLLMRGVEEFDAASTIEEALEKTSTTFFDIALVDLFMPEMNGLHFVQEFQKRMPQTKAILLIEDQQLRALNGAELAKLNSPAILKSSVSRNLPQLLSQESNSMC